MSIRSIYVFEAVCDGCGQTHPAREASRDETAGAAYADGWRFPPEVKVDGSPSTRAAAVCPACLPTFQGKPTADTWKNRRGKAQNTIGKNISQ